MTEPFLRIVDKDSNTEVLRITATEIVVDPNVSVNDAARRVFEALQGYFNLAIEEQASCIRAEALEEAARVISEMPRTHTTVKMCDVMGMKAEVTLTLNNGPAECAAAIRALITSAS